MLRIFRQPEIERYGRKAKDSKKNEAFLRHLLKPHLRTKIMRNQHVDHGKFDDDVSSTSCTVDIRTYRYIQQGQELFAFGLARCYAHPVQLFYLRLVLKR